MSIHRTFLIDNFEINIDCTSEGVVLILDDRSSLRSFYKTVSNQTLTSASNDMIKDGASFLSTLESTINGINPDYKIIIDSKQGILTFTALDESKKDKSFIIQLEEEKFLELDKTDYQLKRLSEKVLSLEKTLPMIEKVYSHFERSIMSRLESFEKRLELRLNDIEKRIPKSKSINKIDHTFDVSLRSSTNFSFSNNNKTAELTKFQEDWIPLFSTKPLEKTGKNSFSIQIDKVLSLGIINIGICPNSYFEQSCLWQKNDSIIFSCDSSCIHNNGTMIEINTGAIQNKDIITVDVYLEQYKIVFKKNGSKFYVGKIKNILNDGLYYPCVELFQEGARVSIVEYLV